MHSGKGKRMKNKFSVKIISFIILFVLLMVCFFSFSNFDYFSYHARDETFFIKSSSPAVVEEDETCVIFGIPQDSIERAEGTIKPFAASSYALSSSVTLTASYTTSDGTGEPTYKGVSWSISWSKSHNCDSSWLAKTLSSYVTMTTSGETATLTCKQAFGCGIEVTCTSTSNSNASATVYLDYAKRISSISITTSSFKFGYSTNISRSITYGTGTVKGTLSYTSAVVTISSTFKTKLQSAIYTYQSYMKAIDSMTFSTSSINLAATGSSAYLYFFVQATSSGAFGNTTYINAAKSGVKTATTNTSGTHATLKQMATYKINGTTVSTHSLSKSITFDASAL